MTSRTGLAAVVVALGLLSACGGKGSHASPGPTTTAPGLPVVNRARDVVNGTNDRSQQLDQQVNGFSK